MRCRGFTLIELLITLAILGILLGVAAPWFNQLLRQQESTAAINQLAGAIQFARNSAIHLHSTVTLCPVSALNKFVCGKRNQWHRGALAFMDKNVSGKVDNSETVIRRFPALVKGSRTYWRSFRNRSYLQINARGVTNWQNGNLLYCPPDDEAKFARQIIVSITGRIRFARDNDNDGIVENAKGKPVRCLGRRTA